MQPSHCWIIGEVQEIGEKVARRDHFHEEKFRRYESQQGPRTGNGWLLWIKNQSDEKITWSDLPLEWEPEQDVWEIWKRCKRGNKGAEQVEREGNVANEGKNLVEHITIE